MAERRFQVIVSVRAGWFRRAYKQTRHSFIPDGQVILAMNLTNLEDNPRYRSRGIGVNIFSITASRFQKGETSSNDFGTFVFFEDINLDIVDKVDIVFD